MGLRYAALILALGGLLNLPGSVYARPSSSCQVWAGPGVCVVNYDGSPASSNDEAKPQEPESAPAPEPGQPALPEPVPAPVVAPTQCEQLIADWKQAESAKTAAEAAYNAAESDSLLADERVRQAVVAVDLAWANYQGAQDRLASALRRIDRYPRPGDEGLITLLQAEVNATKLAHENAVAALNNAKAGAAAAGAKADNAAEALLAAENEAEQALLTALAAGCTPTAS